MMMLVLTVCSFEGTWNIDRNEKQCESAVFFVKQFEFIMKNKKKLGLTTLIFIALIAGAITGIIINYFTFPQ